MPCFIRDQSHEQIPHLGNGGIGQQTLDPGLIECGDIANGHGENGQDPQGGPGHGPGCLPQMQGDANQTGKEGHLGTTGQKGSYRGRGTFVDIRRPEMQRHHGNFKADPHQDKG